MENSYEIYMSNEAIGKACLFKEGLYWKILCRCRLPQEDIHRVIIKTGKGDVDLGILVPEGDQFTLTSRVAMKRLGEEPLMFLIKPKQQPQTDVAAPEQNLETTNLEPIVPGLFLPIREEEPFAHIELLKDSCLEEKDGQVGISPVHPVQESPIRGSDPNQEYPDEWMPG